MCRPALPITTAGLALVVELVRHLRLDEGLQVPDLAPGEASEQRRVRGHGPAGLGDVVAIVLPDAYDLVGVGHDRSELEAVEGQVGSGRLARDARRLGQQ